MTTVVSEPDPFEVGRARNAPGLLRAFNDVGVLTAADVHVALRVAGLARAVDDSVLLAAALAVRAPRLGHVYVDLATIRDTAAVETDEPVDLSSLPWPAAGEWRDQVAASELVSVGDVESDAPSRPLRLVGSWLYLDRYWREERCVARTSWPSAPDRLRMCRWMCCARDSHGCSRARPTAASALRQRPPSCGG
jgi:exodeoxyribonuclease V alpha subunit